MNLLFTSSRMPFALDEIRKFGRRGHQVSAADTIRSAPGSHSRYVAVQERIRSPQYDPKGFIADVRRIVRERAIDLIVPCFEEVFYLERHRDELGAPVFASGLELLAQLHNKASFNRLARSLGIAAPRTSLVTDGASLAREVSARDGFMARPVWSRGGVELYTNAGPLAGALQLADCHPTVERPWIVQDYVDGFDLCTFSVAQRGRVVAHCTYVHPLEIEHGGGIVFDSVDEPETLAIVQKIVGATGYHGQLGMDFRRDGRLVVIECNPRPTAGVHLASDELLVKAVTEPPNGAPRVVPPGVKRKYTSAIVRDLLLHLGHAQEDLHYLFADHVEDVYGEAGDRLPALYQILSYAHVLWYRAHHGASARKGTSLVAAYFDGIEWNGSAIP